MILEALEHLLSPCPAPWRRMGYLREQIAIKARCRRNRDAWRPHLEASRAAVWSAAKACPPGGTALILGAGLQQDLPLEELSGHFDRVVLADLVHTPLNRALARRRGRGNIGFVEFDASGCARRLYHEGGDLSEEELLSLVATADPGLPGGLGPTEPSFTASVGLASQLMLLPLEWLGRKREFSEGFEERLRAMALEAHLAWLRRRIGNCLLVTDRRRRERDLEGVLLKEAWFPGLVALPTPTTSWVWRLAPAPEWSPRVSVEHEVGAWLSAPPGLFGKYEPSHLTTNENGQEAAF
jgi:hypothetical protein